jgi:pimeloyl-ACP methyl ester carboxylesterase
MTLPALVLVHGGGHAADCWDLVVNEIRVFAPTLVVLAVDLPGRRGKPGSFATLAIADWIRAVVADIDAAGLDEVVIVGHSMAGLTVPGVVGALGAGRVREMILAAACVPPEGAAMVDVMSRSTALIARGQACKGDSYVLPRWMARVGLVDNASQMAFIAGRLYPESSRIPLEKVAKREVPVEVSRTWIMTTRDRAFSPRLQRNYIKALGGVQTLIEIDTRHDLMVTEPKRVAKILVQRCRKYA